MGLLLSLCVLMTGTLCTSTVSPQATPDVVTSGLYSIQGCGSNASQVLDVLHALWGFLLPSLTDSNATHTSPSYNAFFKDIYYAPFVNSILSNIAAGAPVSQVNAQPGIGVSSPVIACLSDSPDLINDRSFLGLRPAFQRVALNDCDSEQSGLPNALWIGGSQAIILCPRFFTWKLKTTKRTCPAVDTVAGRFRGLGYPVFQNQVSILLHELIHVYVGAVTNQRILKREAYAVQDCFDMNARHSLYNPSNYQYYVNSVYHQCSNFPVRRGGRDRELFGVLLNRTSDAVWSDIYSNATGG